MSQPDSLRHRALSQVRRNLTTLWAAAAWPFVLMAAGFMVWGVYIRMRYVGLEQTDPVVIWRDMKWGGKTGVIVGYLVSGAVPAALARAGIDAVVWKDLETGSATLRDGFSAIRQVFWRLIILSICVFTATQFASALYVVPGVLVLIFTSFAVPVLVIERTGIEAAVSKSFGLATPLFGTLFWLYVLFLVAIIAGCFVPAWFLLAPLPPEPWWERIGLFWICTVVVISFLVMIVETFLVHMYRGAREKSGELVAPGNDLPISA